MHVIAVVHVNCECNLADATPLDAARWQWLLVGHLDSDFASYVSRGLKFGFDIGHRGHRPALTGRLRLKMQKIHRVNLARLNLLKSREIIERH